MCVAAGRPIRVLQVLGGTDCGGTEKWVLEVLRRRADRFDVDVLVHTSRQGVLAEPIRQAGARILLAPGHRRPWSYARQISRLLREYGPFDIVHSHVHYFSGLVLRMARQAKIPVRIAHSHTLALPPSSTPRWERRAYVQTMKYWIARHSTHQLAASQPACQTLNNRRFCGPKCHVLHCGIDLDPFRTATRRAEIRRELGIDERAFVLGHVGRFVDTKNHRFLLAVLAEFVADPSCHLLLVGDGPLRRTLQQEARERGVQDRVHFIGWRSDVPQLMLSAMDLFVMPSHYEGLGLVLIESQAAGLRCLVSDSVPQEATVIPELVARLSLDRGVTAWADAIKRLRRQAVPLTPLQAWRRVAASDFNVVVSVERLEKLYETALAEAIVPNSFTNRRAPSVSARTGR